MNEKPLSEYLNREAGRDRSGGFTRQHPCGPRGCGVKLLGGSPGRQINDGRRDTCQVEFLGSGGALPARSGTISWRGHPSAGQDAAERTRTASAQGSDPARPPEEPGPPNTEWEADPRHPGRRRGR